MCAAVAARCASQLCQTLLTLRPTATPRTPTDADAHATLAFGHATPTVTGLWAQAELDLTHNATLSDASATVNGAAATRSYLQGNRAVFTARATDYTFSGVPEVIVTTQVGADPTSSYRLALAAGNATTFGALAGVTVAP